MRASSSTYPASPPNKNLMAFGEVLGFASAMFPPVRFPLPECLWAGQSTCSLAGTEVQQPGQGDSVERAHPGTRGPVDQSGGKDAEHVTGRISSSLIWASSSKVSYHWSFCVKIKHWGLMLELNVYCVGQTDGRAVSVAPICLEQLI